MESFETEDTYFHQVSRSTLTGSLIVRPRKSDRKYTLMSNIFKDVSVKNFKIFDYHHCMSSLILEVQIFKRQKVTRKHSQSQNVKF